MKMVASSAGRMPPKIMVQVYMHFTVVAESPRSTAQTRVTSCDILHGIALAFLHDARCTALRATVDLGVAGAVQDISAALQQMVQQHFNFDMRMPC